MKKKTFWYHYNKPASIKFNRPILTVHYDNICHLVEFIDCKVPTYSYNRKTQPKVVIKGKCSKLTIRNKKAIII